MISRNYRVQAPSRIAAASLILGLAALLSACTVASTPLTPGEWLAADLLALDPPEPLLNDAEGADLIAIYARQTLADLHLRLDLLDFSSGQDADLYIALDTVPGGTTSLPLAGASDLEWDALLAIPASGALQVFDSAGEPVRNAGLWVARSPGAHSLALRLDPASLPGGGASLNLQVFSALPGSQEIADQTSPLGAGSQTVQPLPALLAFWDSFPADTPVQALRRWDGAHTGPFGGRHGLYNLLRTARARQIPLALLDLSSPEALAALDYGGGTALVSELTQTRKLSLPASLPGLLHQAGIELPLVAGEVLANWLDASRESQLAFGLPASPLIFAPLSAAQFPALAEALQGYPGMTIFTFSTESDSAFGNAERWGTHTLLRLPRQAAGSAPDRLDFALEARRQMAQAAWDWNQSGADPSRFLTLGGSLPESPFGSPQYARLAFQYLHEHPWVRLLSGHDLQTLEVAPQSLPAAASPPLAGDAEKPVLDTVIQQPQSPWGETFLRAIYTQPYPAAAKLGSLRRGYLGLLPALEAAATSPPPPANSSPIIDCAGDPDRDGDPECILLSERVYAQIELDDGRLALLMTREAAEMRLLIAPSSLLASGLGDPAEWDLGAGESADPQVFRGGFSGADGLFSLEILPDGVRLSGADGVTVKEYRLEGGGLAFQLSGQPGSAWQLPLVSDPQQRLGPNWWEQVVFSQEGNTLRWSAGGAEFNLEASLPGRLTSFRAGEEMLGQAENPERDLPEGMFVPLGMAVVEWETSELEGWLR